MQSIAMKIDTISFALMLRPSLPSHAGLELALSDWSISGMDRHRKLSAHALQLWDHRRVVLFFREYRQVACRQPEDGKAESNEHGGNHNLGPPGRVACTHRVLDTGDGDVEAIG